MQRERENQAQFYILMLIQKNLISFGFELRSTVNTYKALCNLIPEQLYSIFSNSEYSAFGGKELGDTIANFIYLGTCVSIGNTFRQNKTKSWFCSFLSYCKIIISRWSLGHYHFIFFIILYLYGLVIAVYYMHYRIIISIKLSAPTSCNNVKVG